VENVGCYAAGVCSSLHLASRMWRTCSVTFKQNGRSALFVICDGSVLRVSKPDKMSVSMDLKSREVRVVIKVREFT